MGGIHGVGKGTICEELCECFNFKHLSASDVLKWEEISDKKNKKVLNINSTQERLLYGLSQIIEPTNNYLLDGHFCLLNSEGEPERVPENTFLKINPFAIIIITCDVETISSRLKNRDKVNYSIKVLQDMQDLEITFAKEISLKLSIPFFNVKTSDDISLQAFLRHYESTY
ncbi:ATP-binding protein [Winogradskyella flava]|uniref:AAA family ATPase n=1 Tax=Winogradskyella flava TaxID=1884876 RepID=A0A842IMP5_9FLAO|nr:ATP-binding protein [Winogradskyella flava]MBC2844240.1 AAA family ATPase [Winogradskyella flava]